MSKPKRHEAEFLADRALLLVVARFAAYFALFVLAIVLVNAAGAWRDAQLATARVSTAVVTGLGISAMQSGTLIKLANRTLSIDLTCTAVFIVALYSALLLAYPVSIRERMVGLFAGIPVILVVNIARIVAAAQISASAPSAFQFFHDYLFQAGMVLLTAALWAAWLSHARRRAR